MSPAQGLCTRDARIRSRLEPPVWRIVLHDTKLAAKTSLQTADMRKLFTFVDPPYGVAIDHGRVKGVVTHYDPPEPEGGLRVLGLIE